MLTGDTAVVAASCRTLGLEGSRPLLPFKLSVLTTAGETQSVLLIVQSGSLIWTKLNFEQRLSSPSRTMPTARHFWKRQNWQRLRLLLSTGQSLFVRQTYLEFFWTVR